MLRVASSLLVLGGVSLEDPVWWAGWGLPASGASLWQSTGGGVVSASEAPPPDPQVEDQTEP